MTYSETIEFLTGNLLVSFNEIYHSAEIIVNDQGIKQPAINQKDEWIPLAPSDQREILYIRRNGEDTVSEELKLGSCIKSYKLQTPLRVVYFKDHAQNHGEILYKLMQAVLVGGTKLRSITHDKWKLLKDESSGAYSFGPQTAYFALDIFAVWTLQPDNCEQDFCLTIDNPLCRQSSSSDS